MNRFIAGGTRTSRQSDRQVRLVAGRARRRSAPNAMDGPRFLQFSIKLHRFSSEPPAMCSETRHRPSCRLPPPRWSS